MRRNILELPFEPISTKNWKPIEVKTPAKIKYIPLHKTPDVKIPKLISKSPFIDRGIAIIEG